MIRTDKQLRVTKEKIAEFKLALIQLEAKRNSMEEFEFMLEQSGLISLLDQLKGEVREYEELSDENCTSRILKFGVHDFSDTLVKARLIRKMSQSDLAKKIGLDSQAIQRYEANGYAGVGFERLLQIQYALGFEVDCTAQIIDDSIFSIDGYTEEEVKEKENKMLTSSIFQS